MVVPWAQMCVLGAEGKSSVLPHGDSPLSVTRGPTGFQFQVPGSERAESCLNRPAHQGQRLVPRPRLPQVPFPSAWRINHGLSSSPPPTAQD